MMKGMPFKVVSVWFVRQAGDHKAVGSMETVSKQTVLAAKCEVLIMQNGY